MTDVLYHPNSWKCFEEIEGDLVVGHAVQLGQVCQGEVYFQDFDYECSPRNDFLFLDQDAEANGDRFTCLETVPIRTHTVPVLVPSVSIRTDWRVENGDLAALSPCEGFENATVVVTEEHEPNYNATSSSEIP